METVVQGKKNEYLIALVLLFTHERATAPERRVAERRNYLRMWPEVLESGCKAVACVESGEKK